MSELIAQSKVFRRGSHTLEAHLDFEDDGDDYVSSCWVVWTEESDDGRELEFCSSLGLLEMQGELASTHDGYVPDDEWSRKVGQRVIEEIYDWASARGY